jgi:hypothetical protein
MSMTKRHFKRLAGIFWYNQSSQFNVSNLYKCGSANARVYAKGYQQARADIMRDTIALAKTDNPRFDEQRFVHACNTGTGIE